MANNYIDPEDPKLVVEAKKDPIEPVNYSYTERDVILYNLGIGATEKELRWTFEGDDQFSALPTFGVVPQFGVMGSAGLDFLPNFNPVSWVVTTFVVLSSFLDAGQITSRRTVFGNKSTYSSPG
jgi:hypothetical protein